MNRNQWAKLLGITASGILKWEQNEDKRLSRINEVAIRLLCAGELGIELSNKWTEIIINDNTPKRIEIAA